MSLQWSRFTTGLILLGVVMAGAVAFDLGARGIHKFPIRPAWPLGDGDVERGRQAIAAHGCGACHHIPGIRHATGRVGPKLEDFVHQMYIAGVLPNTPDNLTAWIREPQRINPLTAMPDLNVTEQEARDMVAYIYTVP